jgi:hypothetical protein
MSSKSDGAVNPSVVTMSSNPLTASGALFEQAPAVHATALTAVASTPVRPSRRSVFRSPLIYRPNINVSDPS